MIVPPDSFQCSQCTSNDFPALVCESCWHRMHIECSECIWVVRDKQEYAHILCKECAHVEP